MADYVEKDVDVVPVILEGNTDPHHQVAGLYLKSQKAELCGAFATRLTCVTASITLPRRLAENFDSTALEVDNFWEADCAYFAKLLLGKTLDKTETGWSDISEEEWAFEAMDRTALPSIMPGVCLIYTGEDGSIGHWAVTCGEGYVVQVMGKTRPITLSPAEAPLDLYGLVGAVIVEPK